MSPRSLVEPSTTSPSHGTSLLQHSLCRRSAGNNAGNNRTLHTLLSPFRPMLRSNLPRDQSGAPWSCSLLASQVALVCRDGQVLAWGINDFGQLGNGSTDYEVQPSRVRGLEDVKVADVAAGGWHSLALTDTGGEMVPHQ